MLQSIYRSIHTHTKKYPQLVTAYSFQTVSLNTAAYCPIPSGNFHNSQHKTKLSIPSIFFGVSLKSEVHILIVLRLDKIPAPGDCRAVAPRSSAPWHLHFNVQQDALPQHLCNTSHHYYFLTSMIVKTVLKNPKWKSKTQSHWPKTV